MRRWLTLLKHGWLMAWNLALLALVVGVPVVALYRAGWVALAVMLVLAAGVWLLRHPAFILGTRIGRD